MVESWADHPSFVVMMREELYFKKTRLLVFVSSLNRSRKICVVVSTMEAEVKEANLK